MPFVSKRQQRWGHATHQPFARRWDKETPDFAALPESKDDGAMLHGPGGLLATPGLGTRRKGRRWGNRTKEAACTCGVATKSEQIAPGITRIHGNLCNVHGRYGPCDQSGAANVQRGDRLSRAAAPGKRSSASGSKRAAAGGKKRAGGGKGPAKPKKAPITPEQRQAARDAKKAENRANVLEGLGIDAGAQQALGDLRDGKQPDADALARAGFLAAGLVEQAQDGSYRLTGSGRSLLGAADAGDAGRAGDTISGARDRRSARTAREQAAADRKRAAEERRKKGGARGSGGKKQPSPKGQTPAQQQRDAERKRRQAEADARRAQRQAAAGRQHAAADARRAAADQRREQAAAQREERNQRELTDLAQRMESGTSRMSDTELQKLVVAGLAERQGSMVRMTPAGHTQARRKPQTGSKVPSGPVRQTTKAANPDDYLVVEDRTKPSTYHLQVKRGGTPDHRLMGAAWAALHGGYRGNAYEGPGKQEALTKLKRLYAQEKMPMPSEKSIGGRYAGDQPVVLRGSRPSLPAIHAMDHGGIADFKSIAFSTSASQVSPPSSITRSFIVFKDDTDAYRWVARTTTAYRDRDREIITTKALEADAAWMTATEQYGPLRYWHIGQPDPFSPSAPWGPGLDIGDCDYSTVIGRTSIESGTFKSAAIGRAFAESADDYELSPGFFHPPDQPSAAGEYDDIRRFERSVVPTNYGRASNLFTGMTVKEHRMDEATLKTRVETFMRDMGGKGVPDQIVDTFLKGMHQADKAAKTTPDPLTGTPGVAFKSDDAPQVYYLGDGTPGLLQDGRFVALKAAAPAPPMDAEDDPAMGGDSGVDEEAEGEPPVDDGGDAQYIGDMTPTEFWSELQKYLAPVLKMQDMVKAVGDHMGELKTMYSTKDTGTLARIAQLETELATLKGDQPAVTHNEALAALKSSGPQAPPNADAPQVPDDPNRPLAGMAAGLLPHLYGGAPAPVAGFAGANGWQIGQPPPNTGGN